MNLVAPHLRPSSPVPVAERVRRPTGCRTGRERAMESDMSVPAVHEWFRLYLRVVDIGVQIRRGEIRHRTKRSSSFSCLHQTGTKGATHSGMSIDDANSAYRLLESEGMNEDRLERLFLGVDELDRDYIGGMDKRLVQSLNTLLRQKRTDYVRLELTGSDPHQALVVVAARSSRPLPPITRKCFNPDLCFCPEDSVPWVDFVLPAHEKCSNDVETLVLKIANTMQDQSTIAEEVGILELKRKFGFEPQRIDVTGGESESESAILKRKRILARNRLTVSGNDLQFMNTVPVVQRLSPVEIYQQHCQHIGSSSQPFVRQMFLVKSGAIQIEYKGLPLLAQNDVQAILHVIKTARLPVQSIKVANTFLNIQSFDGFCELLRCPIVRLQLEALSLCCLGLPQRKSYVELTNVLANVQWGVLGQLKSLDLSYWNFTHDVIQAVDSFLRSPQLKSIEVLSIRSCITKGHDFLEHSMDSFLSACSGCLKTLDMSANYTSIRDLNSLFGAKQTLEVLQMKNMFVVSFDDVQDATVWDLSRLLTLKFSETYDSILSTIGQTATETIVRALISSFERRVMQIKCLDLVIQEKEVSRPKILVVSQAVDDPTTESMSTLFCVLLLRIQEFGKLQSLRLRLILPTGLVPSVVECSRHYSSLECVFRDGLLECEALKLYLGIPLTLRKFRSLVTSSQLPNVQSMHLSILLDENTEQDHQDIDPCVRENDMPFVAFFRGAAKLRDVVLEWIVPVHSSNILLPTEVFHEIEKAWKSQGLEDSVQYNAT